jgi:parallel beta-helix repeat protein
MIFADSTHYTSRGKNFMKKLVSGIILTLLLTSMLTLAFDIQPAKSNPETVFFDDFNDGGANGWTESLGTWSVVNGEYLVSVGIVENGISTVNDINLTDCIIEAKLRFTDTVGFAAGILFRYVDDEHYYAFELSNEYDCATLRKYSPANPDYGENLAYTPRGSLPIQSNVNYLLRVVIQGNRFTCLLDDQELFSEIDNDYSGGKVGLRARRADAFFDNFTVLPVPSTIIVPDNYPTIQEAINNANDGDTIYVKAGTYYEHVVVNKTVSLVGENESTTIIDGGGTGVVVELQSVHINLSRFTIRSGEKGILLPSGSETGFNTISNNTITSCGRFPYDYAIELGWNRLGHDRFYYNELKSNHPNIGVFGLSLSDFLLTMDTTNTVNGKPVYFLVNQSDLVIDPSNYPSIGYLAVVNSVNVTVRNLEISEVNRQGVLFAFTNNSAIQNLTATVRNYAGIILWFSYNNSITKSVTRNNLHGIRVDTSSYNWIEGNSMTNNYWSGIVMEGIGNSILKNSMSNYEENIALYRSLNNSIYHNNLLGGLPPVIYESYNNSWDDGYPSGGNYWSDYDGSDLFLGENQDQLGSDGIGDTHYVIDGNNIDHCPLMNPWTPSDAAVLNITTSKRFIGEGYSAYLTAVVENQGGKVENLNTTVYVGEANVTFQTFLLKSQNSLIHTFSWGSTGFSKGNYTLSTCVEPIEGEEDLADNTMYNDWVFITIPGDVNGDSSVNVLDAIVLSNAIFSEPSEPNWNANADINNDGKVNILDCIILANHFNQHWV